MLSGDREGNHSMQQIIEQATTWFNLPITILLVMVVLYWALAIFGLASSDALDLDLHAVDADIDLDAQTDMGPTVEAHHGDGGMGLAVLKFLNFGQVPGMLVITVFVVLLWLGMVIGNFAFNADGLVLVAVIVFLPVLLVSALLTKVLTLPMVPLFKSLNEEGDTHESIVGSECRVRSGNVTDESGQAEVDREGASFLINVRIAPGREPLVKGDTALVVDQDMAADAYLIKKIEQN